jgi:hypothetical protein
MAHIAGETSCSLGESCKRSAASFKAPASVMWNKQTQGWEKSVVENSA